MHEITEKEFHFDVLVDSIGHFFLFASAHTAGSQKHCTEPTHPQFDFVFVEINWIHSPSKHHQKHLFQSQNSWQFTLTVIYPNLFQWNTTNSMRNIIFVNKFCLQTQQALCCSLRTEIYLYVFLFVFFFFFFCSLFASHRKPKWSRMCSNWMTFLDSLECSFILFRRIDSIGNFCF